MTRFAGIVVLAAALSVAAPAYAQRTEATNSEASKRPAVRPNLSTGTLGSFTPAGSAGRDLGGRLSEMESRFSFTPSGKRREGKDELTVGVTRRVARDLSQPAGTETTAARASVRERPSAMGAGVDVGYAGFSLSGDYERSAGRVQGAERERVEVGLGYGSGTWRADVRAGASQPADANLYVPEPLGAAVSLELGGALALNPRVALKGGVRYDRIHPEAFTRDFVNRDEEQAKETGTVYLGTSLSF